MEVPSHLSKVNLLSKVPEAKKKMSSLCPSPSPCDCLITLGGFHSNSGTRCARQDEGGREAWFTGSERLLRLGGTGWHVTDGLGPWEDRRLWSSRSSRSEGVVVSS